jgi:hypothetical protein
MPGAICEAVVPNSISDKSDTKLLAEMMRIGAGDRKVWNSEDLSAIFRHQLSAPVQFDLANLDAGLANKLRTLSEAQGLLIRSFADLLYHPNPPVELLELTKQFAKACRNHPDSLLPHEIATLLYFASIVTALTRCGRRITELDEVALRSGIEWLVQQPWVDERMRMLLGEGLARLNAMGSDVP